MEKRTLKINRTLLIDSIMLYVFVIFCYFCYEMVINFNEYGWKLSIFIISVIIASIWVNIYNIQFVDEYNGVFKND